MSFPSNTIIYLAGYVAGTYKHITLTDAERLLALMPDVDDAYSMGAARWSNQLLVQTFLEAVSHAINDAENGPTT